jgi:hypothetical protein
MARNANGEDHGFVTDRLKFWEARREKLEPTFQSTLDNIEKHGWELMCVKGDDIAPGFSYTVGVYEATGQPEIIEVGLRKDTAHYALNEAARRMRAGELKINQREAEIISNVDCVFRPIEDRWIQQLMYRAQWFYNDLPFPAVQCIYPDIENRFPWEEDFDSSWRPRQALLFDGAEWTRVEGDLWAANDPNSSLSKWKWSDPPHTHAFVPKSIAHQKEPVTQIYHEHNGDWQFLGATSGECVLLCLHHLIDFDPTLNELADLPRGWCAWRDSVGVPWQREAFTPSEDEKATEE